MGTSRSAGELAHKLSKLAVECRDMPKLLMVESTVIVKGSVEAVMPRRLRGVGKKGSPIRVYSNVNSGPDGTASGQVATKGQTQLIERDTVAHVIPKARGVRARKRLVVLPQAVPRASGRGESRVFASAHHPGTKGKHLFAKGVAAAAPAVQRIAQSTVALGVRRIF